MMKGSGVVEQSDVGVMSRSNNAEGTEFQRVKTKKTNQRITTKQVIGTPLVKEVR